MLVVTCLGFVDAGILSLHRFFIAISRAVVNHDLSGGTSPDPLVWSVGARPKRRRLVHAVRDRAFLPGPPGIWDSEWVSMPVTSVYAADVATLLVFWLSGLLFLVLFIGPLGVLTLVLVVSLMLSCSFFMNFGLARGCLLRRLLLATSAQDVKFQCRLFLLVQA